MLLAGKHQSLSRPGQDLADAVDLIVGRGFWKCSHLGQQNVEIWRRLGQGDLVIVNPEKGLGEALDLTAFRELGDVVCCVEVAIAGAQRSSW